MQAFAQVPFGCDLNEEYKKPGTRRLTIMQINSETRCGRISLYNTFAMVKPAKTLRKVLSGSKNISFADFTLLVEGYGFYPSRVSGSHHIFIHPDVKELVNLQDVNGQVKSYQVKQFMDLIERYNLTLRE